MMSNNRNEFISDFQPYTDRFGMIQDKTDGAIGVTSGNGNLYTAHYILAASDNSFLDKLTKERLIRMYSANEREPGLMMRAPDNRNGHNAHDDLIGCASASRLIDDGKLAKRIFDYGNTTFPNKVDESEGPDHKKTVLNRKLFPILCTLFKGQIKWCWNNIRPKEFHVTSWLFRRSDVIAVLELVAYKKTSVFRYLFLTIMMGTILFQNKDTDHNAFILRYHMARAIDGINWYSSLLAGIVRNKVNKEWGSIGNVIGAYYQNEEHPAVKWLKNSK